MMVHLQEWIPQPTTRSQELKSRDPTVHPKFYSRVKGKHRRPLVHSVNQGASLGMTYSAGDVIMNPENT